MIAIELVDHVAITSGAVQLMMLFSLKKITSKRPKNQITECFLFFQVHGTLRADLFIKKALMKAKRRT